uniref:Arrestin-C n=1 Tax=Sphenodon punctatus TaxID=8508 RepID=A0A8D0G7M6_SPHPU
MNEGQYPFFLFYPSWCLQLTIYLGKRDFVDHVDYVEPVVYVTMTCAFRYGRDDLDVIGLTFRKDLYVLATQIFPPVPEQTPKTLTPLQEKLMRKLGEHFPYFFQMATNLPCSVTLQPGPDDVVKVSLDSCLISLRLVIRKVQFAPVNTGPAPKTETTRQFMMSDKPLHLEVSLDKEIYYHAEPIGVNVNINNTTSKIVKKIKISSDTFNVLMSSHLHQLYTSGVCLWWKNVAANSTFVKSYTVTPSLLNNREKRGLALDGKLKHEDTNLASTTILRPGMDKEVLGILVSYKVKVNLVVSRGGDVGVELPVTLMHPKPSDRGQQGGNRCMFIRVSNSSDALYPYS